MTTEKEELPKTPKLLKKFEAVCKSYSFGTDITYSRVTISGDGTIHRCPGVKTAMELVEDVGPTSIDTRVNKYNVRTFKMPTFDTLRFYNPTEDSDMVVVLVEDETYDLLHDAYQEWEALKTS